MAGRVMWETERERKGRKRERGMGGRERWDGEICGRQSERERDGRERICESERDRERAKERWEGEREVGRREMRERWKGGKGREREGEHKLEL